MKTSISILSICIVLLLGCTSSKSKITSEDMDTLKAFVDGKQFRVESNWAYPMTTYAVQQVLNSGLLQPGSTANRIDLIGNPNFLEIKGDSVTSYLPYFGERQMQVGYGGRDSAIEFKGLMEDYEVETTKNGLFIKFKAKSNNEHFNVILNLTPKLSSNLTLNSGSRMSIKYSGTAEALSED